MDEYTGFLFADKEGVPLVAMYWEHRFNHMVKRYNDIYRVQMPNILGLENAVDELKRMEELENARKEMEKLNGEGAVPQKMFRAI